MDKTAQTLELQVVDLGDAKELTMGTPTPDHHEENPEVQAKR